MVRIDLQFFIMVTHPGSQPSGIAQKAIAIDMSTQALQQLFIGDFQTDDFINMRLNWFGQAERDGEVLLGWRGLVPVESMEVLDDKFQARSSSSSR